MNDTHKHKHTHKKNEYKFWRFVHEIRNWFEHLSLFTLVAGLFLGSFGAWLRQVRAGFWLFNGRFRFSFYFIPIVQIFIVAFHFDFVGLIGQFHFVYVLFMNDIVVDDGSGVVDADDALGHGLNALRRRPWFVDILSREVFEYGYVLANVVAVLVGFFAERDRWVNAKVLMEEGRCAQPLPIRRVQCPIRIQ